MAAAPELAYRTASTAGPFADSLAGDALDIAAGLREGDLAGAFARLQSSTDRLQRFMVFLVVACEILVKTDPLLAAELGGYSRRILAVLDRVQGALDSADLSNLVLTLEHGLANILSSYADLEVAVQRGLRRPLAA